MHVMKRKKQFERITDYIRDEYDVAAEHLWKKYPEYAVFRHPNSGKWFGLIMQVPANRLGRDGTDMIYVINLHIAPVVVSSILGAEHFMPGYHMNKASWTTVMLDDGLSDAQIKPLVQASYDSVAPRAAAPRK